MGRSDKTIEAQGETAKMLSLPLITTTSVLFIVGGIRVMKGI